MYPFYYPSSSYGASYPSSSSDAEYLRALAEERAAREQYAAAKRAQEEARQRAARARAARRAYAAPYSSYHDDDYNDLDLDMDLDDGAYYPQQRPLSYAGGQRPYGYPSTPQLSSHPDFAAVPQFSASPYAAHLNPRQQRALLEEQRRRELLEEQRRRELVELERERRRQEEERLRRILQEEREREETARRKMLEEERLRRAIEEEKLRRAIEEERLRRAMLEEEAARRERERAQLRAQQAGLEPLLRAFGFVPAVGSDSDSDKERPGRDARSGRATRARTTSPGLRRPTAAPRSPIRPTKSSQPSTSPRTTVTPAPKAPSPAPATTIPITSPKSSPKPAPKVAPSNPQPEKQEVPKPNLPPLDNPTPEQVAAAEKIQDAYRTYSARKHALKSIATLRKRFLSAKSSFTLPTTLDYDTHSGEANDGERTHTTVVVEPSVALPSPSLSAVDENEDPFQHVPKLAYTPTNAPLHAYEEELNRILSALDAVESRGDAGVRAARRELARMVEREAERVERWRGVVWNWWTDRSKEKDQRGTTEAASVAEGSAESAPAPEGDPSAAQQADVAPREQEMQVEPPEQPVEQPMETEPATDESTPKAAPMEVEPEPEPAPAGSTSEPAAASAADASAEEQQPSAPTVVEEPATPEIDIPDADVDTAAPPVEIEVEPPSRAEPALDEDVDVEASEPTSEPSVPEVPIAEGAEVLSPSEPDRPSTPPLSHDQSEAEAEMEVEPEEVHTPPPGEHTPLVVVSPPALDPHEPVQKDAHVATEGERPSATDAATESLNVKQQPEARSPGVKDGASPLVDRSWDEFRTYDMF